MANPAVGLAVSGTWDQTVIFQGTQIGGESWPGSGWSTTGDHLVADLDLTEYVEFKGSLTDEQLVEAYNSFDIFVLASEREGFGFPILEAQRCGVPVIIRNDAHIPPEVSSCCLMACSEEDMADKIHGLLTNDKLRQGFVEKGLAYSQQFAWERTVQETLRVYEEVMA